ncbi:MAG: DUF3106 domain-containing protein [Acidobacteria bacterium]|nr:DUF3106 domain-containing protein [Acidobacteriota bacterium]
MRIRKTIFALITAAALALPALALQNPPPAKRTGKDKKFHDAESGRKRGWDKRGRKGWRRAPGRHGGDWLRKMNNLPATEQERALHNDPEFQRLSPEQQGRLRERLRKFNSLPPEKRQRILERWERFEHLTPEQQERLRGFHQRIRQVPEERRRMMYRALHDLRDMPPRERERVLGSGRFRNMFSEEERDLLRGMAEIGPPPDSPDGAPDAPPADQRPPE